MPDREKVITALQLELEYPYSWECAAECPYYGKTDCDCFAQVTKDAIELLKEQEITVQPERRYLSIDPHRDKYRCSRCGDLGLRYLQRFCGGCGKEVDWLDRI